MKRLMAASFGSFLTLSAANAADPIEPTGYDWTGAYVGLQGGYAWGGSDVTASEGPPPISESFSSNPVTINRGKGAIGLDGFAGGVHAGYNWQVESLVLGFEGDIELADMNGTTGILRDGARTGKVKQEIDWLGSLRLRAGFAVDRALIYATGGVAAGGVEFSLYSLDGKFASNDETNWGWTAGGGVEYALTDEMSARVEYRYTDLGDIDADDADAGVEAEADAAFHAIRAGLSWHF